MQMPRWPLTKKTPRCGVLCVEHCEDSFLRLLTTWVRATFETVCEPAPARLYRPLGYLARYPLNSRTNPPMLLHPHARCGLGPSHLQHRAHAGALQLPSWQRHTRHATAAGSRSWFFPRQAHGVPTRTAITSADSGVSIGSEDAAVAVGPPRQGAEHEQADLSVAASSSMLALSEPAGIMFYGVNGAHEHVRVSHAEPYPAAGAASTSSAAQHLPANGSRTPLGLGTASFAVPIQSWGGDDEPHAAQSAAARAAVESATAAKAATAAEAAAQQAAAAAAAAAAALVQRSQSGSDAQSGASSSSSGSPDAAPRKAGGSMGTRIVFGALLGVGGAAAVAIKQLFLVVLSFITFHATQEYYAMVSSKGITRGMAAPPRIVSVLTTVLCVSMVMFSYFYRGRSGTVLAVAAFFLLVMNMVAIRKPKFSQLASTLFGVFYCGALVVEACGGREAGGMAWCPPGGWSSSMMHSLQRLLRSRLFAGAGGC